MKVIVGLGNPGEKYLQTRHNIGFFAIDYILRDNKYFTAKPGKDFKSEVSTWQNETEKVLFIKPQTYMNDSGLALKVICNFYKLDFQKDLLVIQDEVDLPFGELKLTSSSSAAGHNGIKSIIAELGTQDFSRLRVGIESRLSKTDMPTENFVLQNFSEIENDKLQTEVLPKIQTIVENFINNSCN